jgi:hypothetical protein
MKTFREYTKTRAYTISVPDSMVETVIAGYKYYCRERRISLRSYCRKMPKYFAEKIVITVEKAPEPPEQITLFGG